MHKNILLPLVILLGGCALMKGHISPYDKLGGEWRPVEQIFAGNPFPEVFYASQRLIMYDSSYTVYAETTDLGKIIASEDHMDIYGIEGPNAGKHFKATYTLSNDTLRICYDLSGVDYPATFISTPENFYFLSTFVRYSGK